MFSVHTRFFDRLKVVFVQLFRIITRLSLSVTWIVGSKDRLLWEFSENMRPCNIRGAEAHTCIPNAETTVYTSLVQSRPRIPSKFRSS